MKQSKLHRRSFFKSPITIVEQSNFVRHRRYEAIVFLVVFFGLFGFIANVMGIQSGSEPGIVAGLTHMLNSLMNTSFWLLENVVLYLMAVMVLAGALGKLMIEFGVIRLFEMLLSVLMRPLYGLPGTASLAGLMTFFSDNPAVISLAHNPNFRSKFTQRQLVSLTNYGTAFGMGLIVLTFMGALKGASGERMWLPALIGLAGAVIGSIVSTRLMQYLTRHDLGDEPAECPIEHENQDISFKSEGSLLLRFVNAILDGGKSGVDLGLAIIPGVVIISAFIFLLCNDAGPDGVYTGAIKEGVPLIPMAVDRVESVFHSILGIGLFEALFGFEHSELIAFPITSLGSVGAALAVAKHAVLKGIAGGNEIAVFTAIGMCWSGYLSTHAAMLDTLGQRKLTGKAYLSHTLGGLAAGIAAHVIYLVYTAFC